MKTQKLSNALFLFSLTITTLFLSTDQLYARSGYGLKDISSLITQNYVIAVVFAIVFLLIAALVSNAIKYEGGAKPKDPVKRRRWFWILCAIAPIVLLVYNFVVVLPNIQRGPASSKFGAHPFIGLGVCLIVYILVGFIISKAMKHGKLGHWF